MYNNQYLVSKHIRIEEDPGFGMTDNRIVWDGIYQRRGNLWGGVLPPLAEILPGSRVLELGCGNGKILTGLLDRGCEVVGIDFSRYATVAARAGQIASCPAEVILSDARYIPFRERSFDAVIARHVIGHMECPGRDRIAREIARVLRPGGILLFSGFSCSDFRYGQGSRSEGGTFLRGNGIRTHYFTGDELSPLFSLLSCESIREIRWAIRILGKDHERSELYAVFRKIPTNAH